MTNFTISDDKIVSLYKSGLTMKEITEKYDVCERTIQRKLRKANVRKFTPIKHNIDESVFSIFTPESCYWAGFLAADGSIKKNNKTVYLKLKSDDEGHLRKFCKFLKRDENIYRYESRLKGRNNVYYSSVVYFNSQKIVNDLFNNFNITQNKTFTLRPPEKIPPILINHFIRGFMDGDGSVMLKDKIFKLHMVSGSKNFMEWILNNIRKNSDAVNSKLSSRIMKSTIYELNFSALKAKNILDWLYSNSSNENKLERKHKLYLKYIESLKKNQEDQLKFEQKLFALYDSGTLIKNIAEDLKVSLQTVHTYARKNNKYRMIYKEI